MCSRPINSKVGIQPITRGKLFNHKARLWEIKMELEYWNDVNIVFVYEILKINLKFLNSIKQINDSSILNVCEQWDIEWLNGIAFEKSTYILPMIDLFLFSNTQIWKWSYKKFILHTEPT